MSDLTQLQLAKTQVINLIVDITANAKPNYNIDGQEIDWADYLDILCKKRDTLAKAIQEESGPFLKKSIGVS